MQIFTFFYSSFSKFFHTFASSIETTNKGGNIYANDNFNVHRAYSRDEHASGGYHTDYKRNESGQRRNVKKQYGGRGRYCSAGRIEKGYR